MGLSSGNLEALYCSLPADEHMLALSPGSSQSLQMFSSWAPRKVILEPFCEDFTLFPYALPHKECTIPEYLHRNL